MKKIKTIIMILLGNLILAFGVSAFVIPNNIASGGSTGISLAMKHFIGCPISYTVSILNVAMFVLGFFFLGKKFAMTTIISTFFFPICLSVFESFGLMKNICNDVFLSCIFAGVTIGLGIGLVLKAGASTGGVDIPLLILNKHRHVPVGKSMYILDTLILLTQVPFSNSTEILYGIVVVFTTSFMVNKVLLSGDEQVQLFVISHEFTNIKKQLLHILDNGVTLVHIETGLNKQNQMAVLSVLSNRKLTYAKQIILNIDPKAFMMINSITEVRGKGYTLSRSVDELC